KSRRSSSNAGSRSAHRPATEARHRVANVTSTSAIAEAHPNIALVKYWGKRAGADNVPATPSLSITLSQLRTRTRVDVDASLAEHAVRLNGAVVRDAKIDASIARLVARSSRPNAKLRIVTDNDFPTAAGLASSASGFAALITALDAALDLDL